MPSLQQSYAPTAALPPEQAAPPPIQYPADPYEAEGVAPPPQAAAPPPTTYQSNGVSYPADPYESQPVAAQEEAPAAPAPDVREGNFVDASAASGERAGAGVERIMSGDILGGLGEVAGAAGDQIAAQGGDIFPERRLITDYAIERAINERNTGDSFYGREGVSGLERGVDELIAGPNEPVVQWINENPDLANEAMTKGYTTPEGVVWEAGPTAVWEKFVADKSTLQRAVLDVGAAPVSTIVGAVATPLTTAANVPKAVRVGARAADFVASAGLSEGVPLAMKGAGAGLKKVGILAPTRNQVLEDANVAALEASSEAGAARRSTGALDANPQEISTKGGVTSLTDRARAIPDIHFVEETGPSGRTVKGIVDDPTQPTVIRPVADTDRDIIMQHLEQASYDDYGRISESWYREMFDRSDPGMVSRASYLETLDPDIGVPMSGRTTEWARYRDMMSRRMASIDGVNPDLPVLSSLLTDWDSRNLRHRTLAGITESERRLSAIKKIADQAGLTSNPAAQRMLSEADARLNRGALDFAGSEVGPGRTLIPLSRNSNTTLKAQANIPPADYFKQMGTLNGMKHLVQTRPPRTPPGGTPDPLAAAKYRNYLAMQDQRLTIYGESELIAAKDWMTKLVRTGKQDQAEGFLDAVAASGLLPTTALTPGNLNGVINAITALATRARAEWPAVPAGTTRTLTSSLTPRATAPAPGTYTPGSADEALGIELAPGLREPLEVEYSLGGETGKVWQKTVQYQDQFEKARNLAQIQTRRALTATEQNYLKTTMDDLHTFAEFKNPQTGYELKASELATWDDATVDRLAALRTQRFVKQAQGLVDSAGRTIDPRYYRGVAGRLLKAYDDFAGFRRTMSLYSTTRGPAYVLMQAIGNGFTLALTKPAALRRYTPVNVNAIRKAGTGASTVPPSAVRLRSELGLGGSGSLGANAARDQIGNQTFFAKSLNPIVRGIGKIVAPQWIKEWADAFDTGLRQAVYLSVMEPAYTALRKQLPDTMDRTIQSLMSGAGPTGVTISIGRAQIDAALSRLPNRFGQVQLRDALLEAAGGRGAPDYAANFKAADRVARDYASEVKLLDKAALDEVNRIGFDFRETRADAVLGRVFMFHYWMSRASVLYLTDAARNPLHAQLWARAMSAGNRKAEEEGWPEWQKNWMSFLSTPAGYTAFMNPAYLVGTMVLMREDTEPSPSADLTAVGGFLSRLPIMINPVAQAAIYTVGAGGPDFQAPDLFGTGKWTADLNVWADKVNQDVKQFYATKEGNPKDVPNIDGRQILTFATQMVNNQGWDFSFLGLEPAKPFDANRSMQADMAFYIMDEVVKNNANLDYTTPEGAQEIASMVEEAMVNPDSDLYQNGLKKATDQRMMSSGTGMAPIDFITGMAKHILPFQLTAQSDSLSERTRRMNLDEGTALDEEMGKVIYDTPEGITFWDDVNGAMNAGTPRQNGIADYREAIQNGTIDQTAKPILGLGGRSWTAEQLKALPAEDRAVLAQHWMNVNGYWPEYDARQAAKDEVLANNPDAANALSLSQYAGQYPGGTNAFIQDTMRVNPNYQRYIEDLQTQLNAGQIDEAEFAKKATNTVAYTHIAGIKTSSYDYDPIDTGKGRVAGLAEGETLAGWSAENTTWSTAGSTAHQEKAAALEKDLGSFTTIAQRLGTLDIEYGYAPGTLLKLYSDEVASLGKWVNGSKKESISNYLYKPLADAGFSSTEINPGTDSQVKWYLQWVQDQMPGADLSTDAYWRADSLRYTTKQVERINAGDVSVDAASAEDIGSVLGGLATGLPESALTNKQTALRSQQGGPATIQVPPGLPVTPQRMSRGSDGSVWLFVLPQGFSSEGGWILAEDLQPVA